jgi:hypothetical protein
MDALDFSYIKEPYSSRGQLLKVKRSVGQKVSTVCPLLVDIDLVFYCKVRQEYVGRGEIL